MEEEIVYYVIHGVGPWPNPRRNRQRTEIDYFKLRYVIKAPSLERAYELFNAAVGHNDFEGFREFIRSAEPATLTPEIINGPAEGVWKRPTPLTCGSDKTYLEI